MFNVGNQIIVKAEKQQGFIYSILDENHYVIGIEECGMLKVRALTIDEIELKTCEFGKDGFCNYSTDNGSQGQFACMNCEINRLM